MTSEERRQLKEAEKRQAEAEHARAEAEFLEHRSSIFQSLMFKAMRLELQLQRYPDVREGANSWWFEYFRTDAMSLQFSAEATGSANISEESLQRGRVSILDEGFDMALEWVQQHLEEQELKRKLAEERARVREAALAKLSPQEKEVLGVR